MGMSTPLYKGGRLVGHTCALGHTHPSAETANGCSPETFSKEEKEKARVLEEQRIQAVKDHPGLKSAILAAKALGASDDDAEGVVMRNGVDEVLDVKARLAALKIPVAKVAPKDLPKPSAT